jgi:AraC-like DNA-binding protein
MCPRHGLAGQLRAIPAGQISSGPVGDEVVVQMMPRGDYTAANPAGHLGFQLAFADDKVAEVCDQHEIATPLREDACLIELTDSRRRHMLKKLKALFSAGNRLASTQISDELLSLFVQNFASAPNTAGRCRGLARHRALTRARDYMHDNIGDAITLAEVSRFAHASRRTLTNAFRESFGLGPMAYLKLLRLNRVHQTLRRTTPGFPLRITDVANENGFWHMGQFASDYRQLFGELPSQTQQNRNNLVG